MGKTPNPDVELREAILAIAHAITPRDTGVGEDATGGKVNSVSEALIGVTGGLCRIAGAIESLATAVQSIKA